MTNWALNPGVVSKALSGEAVASEAEFRCQHVQCDSGSRVSVRTRTCWRSAHSSLVVAPDVLFPFSRGAGSQLRFLLHTFIFIGSI